MKMVTGAILLLIAELSFAHTHLIQFPHHEYASQTLLPASAVAAGLGGLFLFWGVVTEALATFRRPERQGELTPDE
jgi:hypothetical protein